MKKKSLIIQLFIVLFIILQALIILLGFSTYKFAEKVISQEVIQLNSNVLQQIAVRINQELKDVEVLTSRIAYDNNILAVLKSSTNGVALSKSQIQKIEGIMAGYIWSNRSTSMLIDAHLIDNQDAIYSTSYSMSSNQNADLAIYSKALDAGKNIAIFPIKVDPKIKGGYNYFFQVVRNVKDHISKEKYGILLLNVNEQLLADNYIRLTNQEKDFMIVDQNGTIISHQNKERIFERLDSFAEKYHANQQNYYFEAGKIFIYRPISDYGWFILESITLESAMLPLKKIEIFLVIFGLISILLTVVALSVVAKKIAAPLTLLTGKMKEFSGGNISVQIPDSPYTEFSEISVSFNELIHQVNYLLEENINNERQKRLLELDFLQAQINPHFIYNTLSSIRFYIEMGKSKEAEEMLYHFSKLLRRVLNRADEFALLKDEIKLIEDYIVLQKMRYPNVFTVKFLLAENTLATQIPSFILQPILENAIFYGTQANRLIVITIQAELVEDSLFITIADNGIGISKEKIAEIFNKEIQMNKIGLVNVHERIRILYGAAYGLTIEPNQPVGSKIILKLRSHT